MFDLKLPDLLKILYNRHEKALENAKKKENFLVNYFEAFLSSEDTNDNRPILKDTPPVSPRKNNPNTRTSLNQCHPIISNPSTSQNPPRPQKSQSLSFHNNLQKPTPSKDHHSSIRQSKSLPKPNSELDKINFEIILWGLKISDETNLERNDIDEFLKANKTSDVNRYLNNYDSNIGKFIEEFQKLRILINKSSNVEDEIKNKLTGIKFEYEGIDGKEKYLKNKVIKLDDDKQINNFVNRIINIAKFKDIEFDRYEKLLVGQSKNISTKLQVKNRQNERDNIKEMNKKLQRKGIERFNAGYKNQESQNQKESVRRLQSQESDHIYLSNLYRDFNDGGNNIDVRRGDYSMRMREWNNLLKKDFGIVLKHKPHDKTLKSYCLYLKENIKKLKSKENPNPKILANLRTVIAFHYLELAKIKYATTWGLWLEPERFDESSTYDATKLYKMLRDVPDNYVNFLEPKEKDIFEKKHPKITLNAIKLPIVKNITVGESEGFEEFFDEIFLNLNNPLRASSMPSSQPRRGSHKTNLLSRSYTTFVGKQSPFR